jgi:hypothetical protein
MTADKANRQGSNPAPLPEDWRPRTATEVADELRRLMALAERARFHPESLSRFASDWLRPSRSELAALTRWYNGAAKADPRGLITGDLRDAVGFVGKIAAGKNELAAEATAARLEYFAKTLEPGLRRLVRSPLKTNADRKASVAAFADDCESRYGGKLPDYATPELLADPIAAMLAAGEDYVELAAMVELYYRDKVGTDRLDGKYHETRRRLYRARNLMNRVADGVAALLPDSEGEAAVYEISLVAGRHTKQFLERWPKVYGLLRATQTKSKATGTVGEVLATKEQPEVNTSPAVGAEAANGKSPRKPGGRNRIEKRRPLEKKVFRLLGQGLGFDDIDRTLNLADEEDKKNHSSHRIKERVERRERRHKKEKADKTGQN